MVSIASIVGMIFTLLVCFALPIVLAILLYRKNRNTIMALIVGTLGFVVPQMMIRIPLLQILSAQAWFTGFVQKNMVLYILCLAFTAGLFETTGRLLVNKLFLKKQLSYTTGFAAGVGHGCIEAIMLIGTMYCNNILFSIMLNMGTLQPFLSASGMDVQSIATLTQQLTQTPAYMFFVVGLERLMAISLHIALSVLLTLCMKNKKTLQGFCLCVVFHFGFDGITVFLTQYVNLWVGYIALAICTSLAILYVLRQHKVSFPKIQQS